MRHDPSPATTTLASSPQEHRAPPTGTPSPSPAVAPASGPLPSRLPPLPPPQARLRPASFLLAASLDGRGHRRDSQVRPLWGLADRDEGKGGEQKKVQAAPWIPPRPVPTVPRAPKPGLFPETHTCLPARSDGAAKAWVPRAEGNCTQRGWQMPTYLPQAMLETSPEVCRGGGGVVSKARGIPVPSSAGGELSPENRSVCPLVLCPAVLHPHLPGLADPADSDSLGRFCGTASRCVPRSVRSPPASSCPQRHHATTRSSVSELGPHSLRLGRGRVSPGAATGSPSRSVPTRAGHPKRSQDRAVKGTPPAGDRSWS